MQITPIYNIITKQDGTVVSNFNASGEMVTETDDDRIKELQELYTRCRFTAEGDRKNVLEQMKSSGLLSHIFSESESNSAPRNEMDICKGAITSMVNFFKEWNFEPNFRFLNTLAFAVQRSEKSALNYVTSYFELTDSPYAVEVASKIKSAEFKGILKDLKAVAPNHTVNSRLKIYYGSQGTGKTTLAMEESDNRCIVCNGSMLPADLMEDFSFADGKATFNRSAIVECMNEGKPIVLDEINLLPFESLRFLQGMLDGKKQFMYKNKPIEIKDGFCIIGTMNLSVNGMTYGLPEPLVDRCSEMRKFTLTTDQLMGAIC